MFRHLLIFVALLMTPSLAFAQQGVWAFRTSEDPLTDQKTSIVVVAGDSIGLGLKCWGGDPDSTAFTVMLQGRYDDAANYKESIDVIVRVDKKDTISLSLKPANLNGRLAMSGTRGSEPKITSVIEALASAKTRVAVGFGGTVFTIAAKGAPKTINSFINGCSSSGR